MTLPRPLELRCHLEVVERRLSLTGIPADVREVLLERLRDLEKEISALASGDVCPPERKAGESHSESL